MAEPEGWKAIGFFQLTTWLNKIKYWTEMLREINYIHLQNYFGDRKWSWKLIYRNYLCSELKTIKN